SENGYSEAAPTATTAVITPRRTRLVRVPDLRALRQSIARLTSEAPRDLFRSAVVIVPTRGAGHQLALSLSNEANADIVTRDELSGAWNARLAPPRRVWTSLEREVLLRSAAIDAFRSGTAPPFDLRPGLIAEMLRFYDQLRRQGQSVHRFEELIAERLGGD